MPPPLVLRIIGDASSYFKTAEATISANTKIGQSALAVGADFEKSASAQVAATERAIAAQRAQLAQIQAIKAKSTGSTLEAATLAETTAQNKLNRTLGVSTGYYGRQSEAVKTADRDLGKLTRGALAGSGVISSLGRSLAFASGGFIAVAGGATLLHNAIQDALTLAATQRQVEQQLKTSGLTWTQYGHSIETADSKLSHVSGFTNQELLQSFGYLVRATGSVSESLKLNAVAADVARGRHIELSSASIALSKAVGGSSTALRRLGIIVPKTATGMAAINFVAQKFAGQAQAGATSADRLRAGLVDASETIGTALLPTFNKLTNRLEAWLSQMEQSGRLTRDVNEGLKVMGTLFHTLGDVIARVDEVTGSFKNTLFLLIGLDLAKHMLGWIVQLRVLAGEWGLVGAAATSAGAAQDAALAGGVAAGGRGATAGGETSLAGKLGLLGGVASGGLLGRALGKGAPAGRIFSVTSSGEATALSTEAGLSATGIGALAAASVIAAGALDDFAKFVAGKFGGGHDSAFNRGADALTGFLTGGFAGNARYSPLNLFGKPALRGLGILPTHQPPAPLPSVLQQRLGITTEDILGAPPTRSPFGKARPMTQFWKTFTLTFREQLTQAQDALTKGTSDDVAEARKEVARIKKAIDEGRVKGPALFQALQLEANALGTIWSAEAAAAQKRAAAAAAAKARIQKQIENSINPITLQLELATATARGDQKGIIEALKKQRAAAEKALRTEKLTIQQKIEAENQIASVNQAIISAQTTAAKTFTEPLKLQTDLAREQAFGKDQTATLKKMKRAALRALHSGKYAGQALIDLLNEISNINSQLTSQTNDSYGAYKKASVKAETAGLGLTAAQRRALEQRLSQRGPGGTTPESGTGAAGYVIDPATGRPVRVDRHHRGTGSRRTPSGAGGDGSGRIRLENVIKIYFDGKDITKNVTIEQQKYRRRNPSSRRGPHAATSTA